jgi:hypothetical protein
MSMPGTFWRHFRQNRLLQFLVGGSLIFSLTRARPRDRIELSHRAVSQMERAQADRLGKVELSPEEAAEVRARAVEDELWVREARRLGLDEDDTIVRQRLAQKMLFLAEADVQSGSGEAELRQFFADTRAVWHKPERVRLIFVFGSRESLEPLRAQLGDTTEPPALGAAFPTERKLEASRKELENNFGDSFAQAVFALPQGVWSAPIQSKHGWHLVRVLRHSAAAPATFEEAAPEVRTAFSLARKKWAAQRFLRKAAGRYTITVDGKPFAW